MTRQRALIIGAGPAGLTAALELLRRTNIQPIVLEATDAIGGISRTIQYKGNRMDIGGHRFFSKSDRVMQWWLDVMPLEEAAANSLNTSGSIRIGYQGKQRELHGGLAAKTAASAVTTEQQDPNLVMLLRPRKSRIYFLRRFFDYPIRLTADTLLNLGLIRTFRAGLSYMHAALFPKREEHTLEDFLVNRFGRQLYRLFFESYTEKVWGVPCSKISAEWGAQRIKGLSLKGVVLHFLKKTFGDYVFSTMPVQELVRALSIHLPRKCARSAKASSTATSSPSACWPRSLSRKRRQPAQGQLDLHPGARCARRPHADLQQLEPRDGRRPGQGLDRPRILLLRDRRPIWKLSDEDS
jgi:phytoene dehydrogenase-like protein